MKHYIFFTKLFHISLFLVLTAFTLVFMPQTTYAATITVNSTSDNLTAGDTFCTLREAIMNANLVAGGDTTSGDCASGAAGSDTITFDASLDGTPIMLALIGMDDTNSLGDLDINNDLVINGNGASNTIIDAVAVSDRIFDIPSTGFTVEINDLTVRNGSTDDGGGIFNDVNDLTINNSVITNNLASDDGGGISNRGGTVTINNSVISLNTTVGTSNSNGGAIRNDTAGTMTINNSLIVSNTITVSGNGGGVFNSNNSMATINNSTIRNNTAVFDGGGVYIRSGTVIINNSTISNNLAQDDDGGGLSNEGGTATVNNSTISGNNAGRHGGGIANTSSASTVNLNYVTITNNTARSDGAGTGDGGGIRHTNGAISNFTSTIITGNDDTNSTVADDCSVNGSTDLTSNGYNMTAVGRGCEGAGNLDDVADIATATPGLDTLQDNGGDTFTHALLGTSPAIDHIPSGTNGCGTTYTADQRDVLRPLDGDDNSVDECDIGAYETGELQCGIQAAAETGFYTFFTNVTIEIDNDGSDLDCLRVIHIDQDHPNATLGIQTGQYWVIDALQSDASTAATTDYSANLILPHSISPDSNAHVCKWLEGIGPGAGWDCARTTSTATTVRRNAVPDFSDWAVGDNVTPTAVSLKNVTTTQTIPILVLFLIILLGLVSWQAVRGRE